MRVQVHAAALLLSGKSSGTYRIGTWVGPTDGVDDFREKFLCMSEFEHRIIQPEA